jgi:sugar phosphate isomerase/epimerase
LKKYPTRYVSLHAKDFIKGKAAVPVGQGSLDWKTIFALAKAANIRSYIAEVGAYNASTLTGPLEPSVDPRVVPPERGCTPTSKDA